MKKIFLFATIMPCLLMVLSGRAFAAGVYSIEEVLRSDFLKYGGASAKAVKPYIVRGYLSGKKLVNCPPCLSPDQSLCAPCPVGQIILAPASNPKSTDALVVGVKGETEISNALQKLELNNIYEFTLKPGQNFPELVSVNNLKPDSQIKPDAGRSNQPAVNPPVSLLAKFWKWFSRLFK